MLGWAQEGIRSTAAPHLLCISGLSFALSVQVVSAISGRNSRFLFYRQLQTSFLYLFYFMQYFQYLDMDTKFFDDFLIYFHE